MAKVLVVVPPREGFNGYWSAGKFWPNGSTEAEVNEEQLAQLKSESLLGVTDYAEIVAKQQADDAAKQQAQAAAAVKAAPPSLLPTREQYVAAGYSADSYDSFIVNRKAELAQIVAEAQAAAAASSAQTSAPTPPGGTPAATDPGSSSAGATTDDGSSAPAGKGKGKGR